LSPDVLPAVKMAKIALAAQTPLRTPLEELTALPGWTKNKGKGDGTRENGKGREEWERVGEG